MMNEENLKKRPKIPRYKKKNGESIVIFTNQQCKIKQGYLHFPKRVNINPILYNPQLPFSFSSF